MTDSIFGLSAKALSLCEDRAVALSNNIVNSATPNYQAKDMDFSKLLQDASKTEDDSGRLIATDSRHLQPVQSANSKATLYRVPMKTNMDGNTVDEEIERKNFLQNALNYQVNLTFIKNTTDKLMKAIKGE